MTALKKFSTGIIMIQPLSLILMYTLLAPMFSQETMSMYSLTSFLTIILISSFLMAEDFPGKLLQRTFATGSTFSLIAGVLFTTGGITEKAAVYESGIVMLSESFIFAIFYILVREHHP